MTFQGSVSTTQAKLLGPCAGHLMTQCFMAFTIARASCILRAGQNGLYCRRSENESSLLSHLADDPFVEDFGSLHIMGGHVFTDEGN